MLDISSTDLFDVSATMVLISQCRHVALVLASVQMRSRGSGLGKPMSSRCFGLGERVDAVAHAGEEEGHAVALTATMEWVSEVTNIGDSQW